MVSSPKAPDPWITAQAQTNSNQQTAQFQQGLNQTNQVTPYGSLTYSGTNNGQPGSATATQTLSAPEQAIFNNQTNAQIQEGDIANSQLSRLGGVLGTPFNPSYNVNMGQVGLNQNANQQNISLNGNAGQQGINLQNSVDLKNSYGNQNSYDTSSMNDAINNKINAIGTARLDPQWAQNQNNFEQEMANRGINPGSQAYQMSKEQFDQSKNDAYNSLYSSAFGAASQAAQADNATNAAKAGFYNDTNANAANFSNQANLAGANFSNQAQQAQTGFNNAANLQNVDYANQAQQNETGFNNNSALQNANFGNNAQLQQTQANNAADLQQNQFNAQQAYAARNQPLNEISALMSGSQVQQPTFATTPQTQVAGTNIAGLINQNYQNKLSQYNSTMGGLFGLGGTLGGAAIKAGMF